MPYSLPPSAGSNREEWRNKRHLGMIAGRLAELAAIFKILLNLKLP